jgi:hypothetical protein
VADPYRVPPPIAPDPYAQAWTELRRRNRRVLALAGVFLASGVGLADRSFALACFLAMMVIAAAVVAAAEHANALHCPRCGKRGAFATRPRSDCMSCGLTAWTSQSDAVKAETRQGAAVSGGDA